MGAFERVKSGFNSLDNLLDNIRLGDNVVLQVSNIDEFIYFTRRFINQAKRDNRNLIYFRFASHEELVNEQDAKIYQLDPGEGFEHFTIMVHRIIEKEGYEAFYIFDSLSDLQVAWAADLMMGNFFSVTCPYLFLLDTVALFPVLRGSHSFDAIARIRETTQLFLDVYSDEDNIYIHPIKVWNRYSTEMFFTHKASKEDGIFKSLLDSVSMTKYYQVVEKYISSEDQNLDSWERFFMKCAHMSSKENDEEIKSNLCRMMMTKDIKIREMFLKYYSVESYLKVKNRMIGTGKIGGKSCGMLIARSIIKTELPELKSCLEPHDSYYIGDHVFYTYLVYNNLWEMHVRQKSEEGYYKLAEELSNKILSGSFPDNIRNQLRRMLEYYGQVPIIVRSSSMLEDGFGNAFAGKYESVFCGNQGILEERLVKLEEAIRVVFASTLSASALEYRMKRGLDALEEQMSILVQRVSGSIYGDYLFPSAAGVGYSNDIYGISASENNQKGMLRMVLGLGTRAVDRTDSDYPRIVHIENPLYTYISSIDDKVKFSQKKLDVIDIKNNKLTEITIEKMSEYTPIWYQNLVLEHDYNTERNLRERGINRKVCFGNCRGYVNNEQFILDMDKILTTLQKIYTYPVDIEYTVNSNENNEYMICLLQCRPLQTFSVYENISLPDICEDKILFSSKNSSMGVPQNKKINEIVLVEPRKYYEYPYKQKMEVANLITEINHKYKDKNKNILLIVPGRIGTSSPELGIPVKFSGISEFCGIIEMDYKSSGYAPELSFGSHIFQDLVETEIFYTALYDVSDDFLEKNKQLLNSIALSVDLPIGYDNLKDMVSVYEINTKNLMLYYDIEAGKVLCGVI